MTLLFETLEMFSSYTYKNFFLTKHLPFIHINLFLNDTSVYIKVKAGICVKPQGYTQIQITNTQNQYHSCCLVPGVELSPHL